MQREFPVPGRQIACRECVRDRAVESPARHQRAAGMAMTLDPIGKHPDEALVDERGLVVTAAVAEEPCAEPCDVGVVAGGESQGPPAAFERVLAASPMKQHLRQPAVQRGAVCPRIVISPQQVKANIKLTRIQRGIKTDRGPIYLRERWNITQLTRVSWGNL